MVSVDLDSWDSFEGTISAFFEKWNRLKQKKYPRRVSTPLFRGHSNASWKLRTTLDRFTDIPCEASGYHGIMELIRPAVVSYTQKRWNLPKFRTSDEIPPTGYEFMIYLRHHGFPSPLLDWTRSPYVAAFFAFRSPPVPKVHRVAIYSYVDNHDASYVDNHDARRGSVLGPPVVHRLGPYVESHKRHYAQQCEYTICWRGMGDKRLYASHESAFSNKSSKQGELKKYTLPVSERRKALKQLDRMNITSFSLFGSEESLMETLAYQEMESKYES